MRKLLRLFPALFCALAGCGSIMSQFAGEWGQFSESRNDITAVKVGERTTDILPRIGKPKEVHEGENIYAGWQEWIYPTGTIMIYRGEVRSVHAEIRNDDTMAKLRAANQESFEFGKFESEKKANQKSEEEEFAEREEKMWGAKTDARSNKYRHLSMEGFSQLK